MRAMQVCTDENAVKSTQECIGCRQFKFLHEDSVPLKTLDDGKHKGVLSLFKIQSYLNST